jgi:hypothetical protein
MKLKLNPAKLVLFYLFSLSLVVTNAQDVTISGVINDLNGNPMLGANIVELGTVNGTMADVNGNFSLDADNAQGTLVISFVGYLTQEIPLEGRTTIEVTLVEDTEDLEEVVVIGYGTVKKSDLTKVAPGHCI